VVLFLYHQSNIDNAISIIKEGKLLSRAAAVQRHLLKTDSASPSVISKTNDRWKHYARLYFRPHNPTFYHVEGFRHAHEYTHGSKCPLPVMFLFNIEKVLCHESAQFSSGNLARSGVAIRSSFKDFEQLPFAKIYHEGPILTDSDQIIFHRNAEVIFPGALPLTGFLEQIVCRSAAERDTLLFLLNKESIMPDWQVNVDQANALFIKNWLHIARVRLSASEIEVELSQRANGLPIKVFCAAEGQNPSFELPSNFAEKHFQIKFQPTSTYTVQIFIAGDLAYANEFFESDESVDLPF